MTTGERLVAARKKLGMTQESLSEISGISLRTVQRIETGETVPRAHTLKTLALHLEISIDEFAKPGVQIQGQEVFVNSLTVLQRMNAVGLTVIIFPLLPIVLSWLTWKKHHRESDIIHTTGKRIIGFYLFWITFTLFALIVTKVVYYLITGFHMVGHISPVLLAYLAMVAVHLVAVIYSALSLKKGDTDIYGVIPPVFG